MNRAQWADYVSSFHSPSGQYELGYVKPHSLYGALVVGLESGRVAARALTARVNCRNCGAPPEPAATACSYCGTVHS
jgi:hypothetical protein